MTGIDVTIDRRRLARALLAVLAAILVLRLFVRLTDRMNLIGETLWRRLSNVEAQVAFPTWFSAVLLLTTAVLFFLIARRERRQGGRKRRHWAGLAIVFLILSIDEVLSFQQALRGPFRQALRLEGVAYYAWVVPAVGVSLILVLVYARFLVQLPARIRTRIVLSGLLFLAGEVGMELVGRVFAANPTGLGYFVASTLEETLEFGAVILLIDTLLLHLDGETVRLAIKSRA